MTPDAPTLAAHEINRLHSDVVCQVAESQASLNGALASAWRAGQLLLAEKKRVCRMMGGGAWLLWLRENFRGSPRTAQRYMRLAQTVSDAAFLRGMSLRQAYDRLGVATEPKSRAESARLQYLPAHVRLAHRLLVALRPSVRFKRATSMQRETYRQDLRPLYEELRGLFEANASNPTRTPDPRRECLKTKI